MTTAATLYAATPRITVDGSPSGLLAASLETLVVSETSEGLSTCEASFQNVGSVGGAVDFLFFDRSLVDFGARIEVTAGDGERAGLLFSGRVTGMRAEFPRTSTAALVVLAEDRLQDLRMTRRTRTFRDVTDAAVFAQVAADHGLRPDVDLDGPVHPVLVQVDQSDLAFLRERARRVGAEVWVRGDVLGAAPRAERRGRPVVLSHRQNLREAHLSADLAHQRTSVSVGGWDPAAKQAIDVASGAQALASERGGGGRVGPDLLETVFGPRADRVVHLVPSGAEEAQAIADARLRALARRFVSGEVVTEGDARLQVGGRVQLVGVGPWFSGDYDLVEVEHQFDLREGFRTRAGVERAELAL